MKVPKRPKLKFEEEKALLQLKNSGGLISPGSMKFKTVTNLLQRLHDKGLIEFDREEGIAPLTDEGELYLDPNYVAPDRDDLIT